MERLGERVRALREELGMSQSELARALGKKPHYVNQLESGVFTPSVRMLCHIAVALDVAPHELLQDGRITSLEQNEDDETKTYLRRIRKILENENDAESKELLKGVVDLINGKKDKSNKKD